MNSIVQSVGEYITDGGHNMTADGLGPLEDNGGRTLTHALLMNSPAIDNGTSVGEPASDQRGVPRPQSFSVDIGAFELEPGGSPRILSISSNQTAITGSNVAIVVRALALQPARLQWFRNGQILPGTAQTSLALAPAQFSDTGGYTVVVSNAFGSVTSAVAWLTVLDPAITVHPVSQHKHAGQSAAFGVTAVGTGPISFQWWKDAMALPDATEAALTLPHLQGSDAGDYRVVVSNTYGSVTSAVAQLFVNLATIDNEFNPGANSDVSTLAVQADGKILLGGHFTTLRGEPFNRLGRLNADGTLDRRFPKTGVEAPFTPHVDSLAIQADGRILVGGAFTTLHGEPRNYLGRLNVDGTLDSEFDPVADDDVLSVAVQADGKILVGGYFKTLGGESRTGIARLNSNGTPDGEFNPQAAAFPNYRAVVNPLALQAGGKVLVGGEFMSLGGPNSTNLARLNADGALDPTFNAGATRDSIRTLAVQADGRVLVGGNFTKLAGQPRTNLARMNADGTLDGGFNPGASGPVNSLAVQADGRILVGGYFTKLGGQTRTNLARLNADGTLDSGFDPTADDTFPVVYSLAVQADGKVLVGGRFTTLGGQPRTNVARLNNTAPATQNLSHDGSSITWLRGGTSPEVWRTTFEVSTNDSTWIMLGPGTRILGGWQLAAISIPPNGILRARGFVSGSDNSSGWFVETVRDIEAARIPTIVVNDGQLGIRSNRFGFTITGSSAASAVVDTSTNLIHWTPLTTNSFGAGPIYFSDPVWPLTPQRFYRVRNWP